MKYLFDGEDQNSTGASQETTAGPIPLVEPDYTIRGSEHETN